MLGSVEGQDVLDLYAGSGALGIEALSRGAASATFVDSDARAVAAIRHNLAELGLAGDVWARDALAWLAGARRTYGLLFVDPPYDSARLVAEPLAERLLRVADRGALIVTESDRRQPLELPLPLLRERAYGDTRIAIHRGR